MHCCIKLAASLAALVSASIADDSVDVVVVGAGYSGLSAARDLRAAGLSVRVFEAAPRAGGRTLSYNLSDAGVGNGTLELGGEWLNPRKDHPHAWKLIVDELGFKVDLFGTLYGSGGDSMLYDLKHKEGIRLGSSNGTFGLIRALGLEMSVEVVWIWEELSRLQKLLPHGADRLDNMTFETWLQEHHLSADAHEVVRVMLSLNQMYAEPSQFSALEAVCIGGGMFVIDDARAEAYVVRGGLDGPARSMAVALGERVHLGAPVTAISQDDAGVLVSVQPGKGPSLQVRAKRVLFSGTPHTALKVEFTPDLPARRRELYKRLPLGNVVKVHVVYSTPFWKNMNLSGAILNFEDVDNEFSTCTDNSPPDVDVGVIFCMSVGNFGEKFMRESEDRRREITASFLAKSFGEEAKKPIFYADHDWTKESHIGGAVNPMFKPGALTEFDGLLTEDFKHVTWIGSDVSTPIIGSQYGFVEGAIKSGREAAKRVIEELHGVQVVV